MLIKIDPEFKALIPPLKPEEFEQLEKNIIAEGCRDALVLWNGTLIDGHNRHDICTRKNIEYKTKEMEFASREDVKQWIITNQLGRRNLSDFVRYELLEEWEEVEKEKGRKKQSHGQTAPGKTLLSKVDKSVEGQTVDERNNSKKEKEGHNTRAQVGEKLGWGDGKVARAKIVKEKAPEEIKEKLRTNEITINKAYSEIKKAERKEDIQRQKKEIETGVAKLPEGVFEVICIDPPWAYGTGYDGEGRRVANPYPEMNQDELKKIEIPAADDCVMFLWTTHRFIWDAKQLLDHWGFGYRATLVWDKEKIGMGDLFRMQCEFCIVGIKGKPTFDNNHTYRDIIQEPRREHSRKPEKFYQIVNELCVGRKLDYFSRNKREGWEVFGNETEKF